jgi:hypothetical protein
LRLERVWWDDGWVACASTRVVVYRDRDRGDDKVWFAVDDGALVKGQL